MSVKDVIDVEVDKFEGLVSQIYELLECKELQTRPIIHKFLSDIKLFDKKQHDYGPQNIAKFGTTGVLVRSSDKLERLINLYKREEQPEVAEPITETWQDLSVYGAIARVCEDGEWVS
jgi:hypothetical protein